MKKNTIQTKLNIEVTNNSYIKKFKANDNKVQTKIDSFIIEIDK